MKEYVVELFYLYGREVYQIVYSFLISDYV